MSNKYYKAISEHINSYETNKPFAGRRWDNNIMVHGRTCVRRGSLTTDRKFSSPLDQPSIHCILTTECLSAVMKFIFFIKFSLLVYRVCQSVDSLKRRFTKLLGQVKRRKCDLKHSIKLHRVIDGPSVICTLW